MGLGAFEGKKYDFLRKIGRWNKEIINPTLDTSKSPLDSPTSIDPIEAIIQDRAALYAANAQLKIDNQTLGLENQKLRARNAHLQSENNCLSVELAITGRDNVRLQTHNQRLAQEIANLRAAQAEKPKQPSPSKASQGDRYYEVLGLDQGRFNSLSDAEKQQVVGILRTRLAAVYHPDNHVTGNLERMKDINEALDALDPTKRRPHR